MRLSDVIQITEKQLRSLRYQASRAKRYRELSRELQKKRVTWALCRYHGLLEERKGLSGELEELGAREERANRELHSLLDELGRDETGVERAAADVRDAEAALLGLDAELRSARERAEHR